MNRALILALCCITGLALGKSDKAHGQRFQIVGAGGFPIGLNLSPGGAQGNGNTYNAEQPFLDFFKLSQWITVNGSNVSTSENTLLYQSFLDANGYPTTLTGGPTHLFSQLRNNVLCCFGSAAAPSVYYEAGDYLLQWTGTANITYSGDSSGTCTVSPCKIAIASPSPTGIQFLLTTTGAGAAYAHNMSFIYCSTWSGSACSNGNDTQLASCQAGTYTNCFNPQFIARLTGVPGIRFMKWMEFTDIQNWADRKLPTWYTYVDSPHNVYQNGSYPTQLFDPVPAEIMFALCNKLNADCWFSFPPFVTDDYVTQFATLAHSSMNSNLKAYVEYGNEWWNFVQVNTDGSQIGAITAKIDNGSGSAGNILTVSALTTDLAGTPILHNPLILTGAGLPTDGAGRSIAEILTQTGGTPGGVGTYTLQIPSNLLISSEAMTVGINANAAIENAGAAVYANQSVNPGALLLYGEGYRAVQVGHLFQAAWGADSARVVRVAAGQAGCAVSCGMESANCALTTIPNGASNCQTTQLGPSVWYGSTAGTVAANVDAYAVAPYWGYAFPAAWTNDVDGGLTHLFTEMITGGLEPSANVPGNCGNGAGKTCDPVDSAHFTITTGSSLSSDPANGFMIQATMNTNNTATSGHTFLTVDTISQYPILLGDDTCPGNDIGASNLSTNQVVVFIFTSAVSGCTGGSITKGWRAIGQQNLSGGTTYGMIDVVLADTSAACSGVSSFGGGIPLLGYEGGQTFDEAESITDPFSVLITAAMRDSRMTDAYKHFFRGWKSLAGGCTTGILMAFDDIEPISTGARNFWWGTLESVLNTSSPRYNAIIQFNQGNFN